MPYFPYLLLDLNPLIHLDNPTASNAPSQSSPQPNNTTNPDIHTLTNTLATTQTKLADLETAYTEQSQILSAYETSIKDITRRLRDHGYEQQTATIALHAHYNALLTTSRNETIQAQLTHQAWQASLSRVTEFVRLAQRDMEESSLPYRRRIAALKEENRVLRAKAGWEPAEESEDEGLGMEEEGSLGLGFGG